MATLYRLILASGSYGRRELLRYAGYPFEVIPSNIDEDDGQTVTNPRQYVAELAWQKAEAVAKQLPADAETETLILAADSTVWHQERIIGKPVDEADARRILGSLAGTTHELWTGVCLWRLRDGVQVCWQERSELYFKPLTPAELDHLIDTKVWEGKAGGYGIESHGDPYLTVKTGTISNVIGLPMESLAAVLGWFAPGFR
jgi:septum formation protein